ncbi:retrovirus-related pol polyprotein from transposon TNT 1-94 [Tanacetum coccineum]
MLKILVRHTSIRVILALTAYRDYELEHLDVKTTFLHGNRKEVFYMRQPRGYEQGVRHEGARGRKENSWYGDHKESESQDFVGVTIWDVVCKCGWELNVLDGVHEARHSVCGLSTLMSLSLIREVLKQRVEVMKVDSEDNDVNAFAKVALGLKFQHCSDEYWYILI